MAERVAVFGAGQMGNGIAHVFAQSGFDVTMIDVSTDALERGRETVASNLDRQIKKGTLQPADKDADPRPRRHGESLDASARARARRRSGDGKSRSQIQDLRRARRRAGAGAILATNTSSISITEIAARTKRPEQVIGMHFMNPVPVMQLVEVIRGLATSDETTRRVLELSKAVGKTPVEVQDYPGFIANRILMPMINEAIYCLMEGVGTAEAIDTVMKLGMNHPMGPLALADLIGLDTCLAILEVLHDGLGDPKYRPCPLLRKYVAAGGSAEKRSEGFLCLPRLTGRRSRRPRPCAGHSE